MTGVSLNVSQAVRVSRRLTGCTPLPSTVAAAAGARPRKRRWPGAAIRVVGLVSVARLLEELLAEKSGRDDQNRQPDSCAGPTPLSRSRTRSRRNRWMAAECKPVSRLETLTACETFSLTPVINIVSYANYISPGGTLQMSAASANLDIKNIGQISIIVHDLPRATAFTVTRWVCHCSSRRATWLL